MGFVEDITIRLKFVSAGLKAGMTEAKKQIDGVGKMSKKTQARMQGLTKSSVSLGSVFRGLGQKFQAWALGIMFFGMLLQRVFTNLFKTATKTFNEISHSIEGVVTPLDQLAGGMKFLWFTLGSAISNVIEPFLPLIMDIIFAVTNWIEQNEGLAAGIVIFGLAIGTLLMVFGQLSLAFFSFIQLGMLLNTIIVPLIPLIGALIVPILLIIAAIVILAAMWKTNFGGMRDTVKVVFGNIWTIIKKVFGFIWNIVKDVFALIKAIFSGDGDEIARILKRIGARIINIVVDILAFAVATIRNLFNFLGNIIIDIIFKLIVGIIQLFANLLVDGIKATIKNISQIFTLFGGEEPAWVTSVLKGIDMAKGAMNEFINNTIKPVGDTLKESLGFSNNYTADDVKDAFGITGDLIDLTSLEDSKSAPITTNNNQSTTTINIEKIEPADKSIAEVLEELQRAAGQSPELGG